MSKLPLDNLKSCVQRSSRFLRGLMTQANPRGKRRRTHRNALADDCGLNSGCLLVKCDSSLGFARSETPSGEIEEKGSCASTCPTRCSRGSLFPGFPGPAGGRGKVRGFSCRGWFQATSRRWLPHKPGNPGFRCGCHSRGWCQRGTRRGPQPGQGATSGRGLGHFRRKRGPGRCPRRADPSGQVVHPGTLARGWRSKRKQTRHVPPKQRAGQDFQDGCQPGPCQRVRSGLPRAFDPGRPCIFAVCFVGASQGQKDL